MAISLMSGYNNISAYYRIPEASAEDRSTAGNSTWQYQVRKCSRGAAHRWTDTAECG